jgi:ABC-type bacteriocin/lantibiotic exporter with double-glycine peptidase domain
MISFFALPVANSHVVLNYQFQQIQIPLPVTSPVATTTIPEVPFYSQFSDITSPKWQKVGCGIASLAMVIDYYKPAVPVNTLLAQGIAAGAYLNNAGWTYKGLIGISRKYGLDGSSHDLGKLSSKAAFAEFEEYLNDGPVIASVHYKFDPKSTIPHLVVINGIKDGVVYYNDPAAKTGELQISTDTFLKAWKKRFVVVRPASETKGAAIAQK